MEKLRGTYRYKAGVLLHDNEGDQGGVCGLVSVLFLRGATREVGLFGTAEGWSIRCRLLVAMLPHDPLFGLVNVQDGGQQEV